MYWTSFQTLNSANPFLKTPPQLPPFRPRYRNCNISPKIPLASPLSYSTLITSNPIYLNPNSIGLSKNKINFGFILKAQNHDMDINIKQQQQEVLLRGQSSMPDRFRPLTKEAPNKPLRWPWFIALGFLLYAWRTVLWELTNWRKALVAIFQFFGTISKLILASIFLFIGDPLTSLIRSVETTLYTVRASYSWLIAYAPLKELTIMITLASIVLSIAEASVPDSVNNQQYLLSVAGAVGYAALAGYITELFFWTLLLGLFGFARLVKKRDYVSSALPVAVVLAAVGEPWVRMIAMVSFLAVAIFHYSKKSLDEKEELASGIVKKIPVPLVCAAFAIGIHLAAKWAGYRHLTWMIA